MHFSKVIAAAVAASAVTANPVPASQEAAAVLGLDDLMKQLGRSYVGTATSLQDDADYFTLLRNTGDLGQLTPENSLKFAATEPQRGTFVYKEADRVYDFSQENDQLFRCHTLLWYEWIPSWVTSGNFDKDTIAEIMQNHIKNVVTKYKGKCLHWDVVNEAVDENGKYRSSPWFDALGENFIPMAFDQVAKLDPDTKLYYNDYDIEKPNAKATAVAGIVNLIKGKGVRIDGVGVQSHLKVGQAPTVEQFTASLNSFTTLGVDVALTELDVKMTLPADDAKLKQQASDFKTATQACINNKRCVGITFWGPSDKYSWITLKNKGEGAACPWDEKFQRKPAYFAMRDALTAAVAKV